MYVNNATFLLAVESMWAEIHHLPCTLARTISAAPSSATLVNSERHVCEY
jgi:hypothetical protein